MDGAIDRRQLLVGVAMGTAALSAGGLFSPLAAAAATPAGTLPSGTWVRTEAGSDLLFLSGAAALDLYHRHPHVPRDEILPADITAQTHMTLRNIYEVLRITGLEWKNVVSVLRYQRSMADSPAIERVLRHHFGDWQPAMSAVQIERLSAPTTRIELEMIAVAPRHAAPTGPRIANRRRTMADLEVIQTRPALADTTIFAPGIRVDAGADIVFLSGITAAPLSGQAEGFVMPEDFDEQVRLATRNIDAILAEIGVGKERIVRIVTFYTDSFSGREMGRYLGGWRPCSSSIGVRALPVAGAKVAYDLVVAAPEAPTE